jgi:hypothetical protein
MGRASSHHRELANDEAVSGGELLALALDGRSLFCRVAGR